MASDDGYKDWRFTFKEIHKYLLQGVFPSSFSKSDKQALRKRVKFFALKAGRRKHLKSSQVGIMSGWGALGSQIGGLGERCKLLWQVWGGAPEAVVMTCINESKCQTTL